MERQRNQGLFVARCFEAGGSRHFSPIVDPSAEALASPRSLYQGNRDLTMAMRGSFPTPVDVDGLRAYFDRYLAPGREGDLLTELGIPLVEAPNRKALTEALARQFARFIAAPGNEAENGMALDYQQLILGAEPTPVAGDGPRYSRDSAYLHSLKDQNYGNQRGRYNLQVYEQMHYTFVIRNTGSCHWQGRRLVFQESKEIRPQVTPVAVALSDAAPGEDARGAVLLDARGFEGDFNCRWVMVDAAGEDCFPQAPEIFTLRLVVAFDAKE